MILLFSKLMQQPCDGSVISFARAIFHDKSVCNKDAFEVAPQPPLSRHFSAASSLRKEHNKFCDPNLLNKKL